MSCAAINPGFDMAAAPEGHGRMPRRVRWMLLAIMLVAVGVYANSIVNQFTYDDRGVIVSNPTVIGTEWLKAWDSGYWFAWEGQPDRLYRPLTILSYIANQALSPGNPLPFHAINIVLNALVALLVGVLAWRLTRNGLATAAAALLFAVHPLHTEVVANVVGRAELLAALWSLLAILIYMDAAGPDETPRPWWHGLLVGVCWALALLSKETPAALPVGLVVIDVVRWWHARERGSLVRYLLRQGLRYYLPLTILFGGYLALRVSAVGLMTDTHRIHPLVNPLVQATVAQRIVTPFMLLGKYLALWIWPATLLADYSAPSLMPTTNLLNPLVLVGLVVTLACVAGLVSFRRYPAAALLAGLFLLGYLPVSNVVRIGTIFGERLFYWPSVFVCIAMGIGVAHVTARLSEIRAPRPWKFASAALAGAAVVALSVRTIVRNPDWHDNVNLALATAADNLTSAKACAWAGSILVNNTSETWTQDFGAQLLERAVRLKADTGSAYMDLAKLYARRDNLPMSLMYLTRAAREQAGRAEMRVAFKGVRRDLEKASPDSYMPLLKINLEQRQRDPSMHLAMGLAYWAQKDYAAADKQIGEAVQLDPYYDEALAELGMLKLDEGNAEEAAKCLREYVGNVGDNGVAECALIRALLKCDPIKCPGALAEAAARLKKVASAPMRDPDFNELRNELLRRQAELKASADRRLTEPVAAGETPGGRPL